MIANAYNIRLPTNRSDGKGKQQEYQVRIASNRNGKECKQSEQVKSSVSKYTGLQSKTQSLMPNDSTADQQSSSVAAAQALPGTLA